MALPVSQISYLQLRLRWSNPARDLFVSRQQSLSRFIYYCASKPSCEPVSITPACLKKSRKQIVKHSKEKRFGKSSYFKKRVIKIITCFYSFSLFSDEQGWKETSGSRSDFQDESPGSSINTSKQFTELLWTSIVIFITPKMEACHCEKRRWWELNAYARPGYKQLEKSLLFSVRSSNQHETIVFRGHNKQIPELFERVDSMQAWNCFKFEDKMCYFIGTT